MNGRRLADGRWLLEGDGRRWLAPEAVARRWLRDGPPPELPPSPPRRRLRLTLAPARLVAGAGGLLAPAAAGPALAGLGVGGGLALIGTRGADPGPTAWPAVLAWVLVLALVHELGHAAGLVRGGGRPGAVGAGWALLVPVLWCDVTEVALLAPRERVRTDLAGPAFQLGAAGLAALIGAGLARGELLLAAQAAALAAGVSLLPLGRTDGARALADALDLPDLTAPLPAEAGTPRRRAAHAARLAAAAAPLPLLAAALWRGPEAAAIVFSGPPALAAAAVLLGAVAALLVGRAVIRRGVVLIRADRPEPKRTAMPAVARPRTLTRAAARLTAALARAETLLVPLDADGLARRGPRGGWSVAQVLEHVCLTADAYIISLRPALDRLRDRPAVSADHRHRPSLAGRFLAWGVDPANRRRVPAPGAFQPSPRPRDDVRDHVLRLHLELLGLMRAAEGRPLSRAAFRSPVTPLLRVNAWDVCVVLPLHLERHLDQIERILADG